MGAHPSHKLLSRGADEMSSSDVQRHDFRKKKKKHFKNDFLKFPLNETLGDLSDVSKRKREEKNKTKHKIKVYA